MHNSDFYERIKPTSRLIKKGARPPNVPQIEETLCQLIGLVIPGYPLASRRKKRRIFDSLKAHILDCLAYDGSVQPERAQTVAEEIFLYIPTLSSILDEDAAAIYRADPSARSSEEVMLCYTSFFAIAVYRIAHELYEKGIPYMPRIMSELAHGRTGIDIHPGARIGRELCIDHGTGIVIGETTVIGDRVRIYQGVTLGAKSLPREGEDDLRGKRRHPTIGNDCVIYSGATILGGETVIGDRCVIGANVRLTHSVSSGQTVYSNKK